MELKEFQLNAVKKLFEAMETPARDIILKSPTGSGKTIILTYFIHQYIQSFPKTVFVWLTPGKGNLEEQSKAKMDMMNQHKRCISECRVEILQSPLDILSYRAYSAVLPSSGGRLFCVLIEKLRNFSKTPCQTAPLIQSK